MWSSEPVQTRVESAKQTVREQAPVVADKLGVAAKSAGSAVKDKVTGEEHLPPTIHRGTDGKLHADTTGFGPGPGQAALIRSPRPAHASGAAYLPGMPRRSLCGSAQIQMAGSRNIASYGSSSPLGSGSWRVCPWRSHRPGHP